LFGPASLLLRCIEALLPKVNTGEAGNPACPENWNPPALCAGGFAVPAPPNMLFCEAPPKGVCTDGKAVSCWFWGDTGAEEIDGKGAGEVACCCCWD